MKNVFHGNSKMKLTFGSCKKTSKYVMCKTLAWFVLWKEFPKDLNKLELMKRNKNQKHRDQNKLNNLQRNNTCQENLSIMLITEKYSHTNWKSTDKWWFTCFKSILKILHSKYL